MFACLLDTEENTGADYIPARFNPNHFQFEIE